jgi:hypothetical protein
MACKTICRLCNKLVISQSVTFTAGTGLIINIPAGSYADGQKVCLVIAQRIPAETTITAPVFITIGTGTQLYPLNRCDCTQATACNLRTRTRYSTRISTTATGGAFKLLGRPCCSPDNSLAAINGTAPTTTTGGGDAT